MICSSFCILTLLLQVAKENRFFHILWSITLRHSIPTSRANVSNSDDFSHRRITPPYLHPTNQSSCKIEYLWSWMPYLIPKISSACRDGRPQALEIWQGSRKSSKAPFLLASPKGIILLHLFVLGCSGSTWGKWTIWMKNKSCRHFSTHFYWRSCQYFLPGTHHRLEKSVQTEFEQQWI